MALTPEEIQRISDKVGYNVATLPGVRLMIDEVKKKTNISLGRNTLRRLFGLDLNPVKPRKSTLNAIATAIGYPDWEKFLKDKPILKEDFYPYMVLTHDMTDIEKGVLVGISWNPDRSLLLKHLGEGWYNVEESIKGKLRKDDILCLERLTIGLPFSASKVVRNQVDIGPYNAASWSAIDDISFFPNRNQYQRIPDFQIDILW